MFHWILDTGYLVTYYHIPGPGHWAGRVMGLVSGPGKLETGESEQCSGSTFTTSLPVEMTEEMRKFSVDLLHQDENDPSVPRSFYHHMTS